MQGGSNEITAEPNITRIKKDKSEDIKSVISENIRIINNKCPQNVEILRGKDELEIELKRVRGGNIIAVAYAKNRTGQYENMQSKVSDMESDQNKLQICIDYLTSDLVLSCESANRISTNLTKKSIIKFQLMNMW